MTYGDQTVNSLRTANALASVVIGRNEGDRLRRALDALKGTGDLVYVDSASTDESVTIAEAAGADVVALNQSAPFSAARGRNAGFAHLREKGRLTRYVQFVDGDCEVSEYWLDAAAKTLDEQPDAAIVCGRLRERDREATIFNRLCDMEWDMPRGEVPFSGGIFMGRATAFEQVGGFDASVVAGEEPELCLRLRQNGWKILRIDQDMAWHDAAMDSFSQWWRRNVRNGHAFAEGADRHGRTAQRHWVRETLSNWFWGLIWPLMVLALAWPTIGLSLLGLLAYPLMVLRIAWRRHRGGDRWSDAWLYGAFTMLGKLPNALGQLKYWCHRITVDGLGHIGRRAAHGAYDCGTQRGRVATKAS